MVHVTGHSTDTNGVTYSLTSDSSSGGFTINSSTGVVTVVNSSKIDFESSGGSYSITIQAIDPAGNASTQTFTIAVTDVAPSKPVDGNAATNTVVEGAAVNTLVGITASSSDVNGGTVTYSLSDDARRRLHDRCLDRRRDGGQRLEDRLRESATSHNITVKAADASGAFTTQTFSIAVTDVAPSQPSTATRRPTRLPKARVNGDLVGITATSSDVNGGTVTYSAEPTVPTAASRSMPRPAW